MRDDAAYGQSPENGQTRNGPPRSGQLWLGRSGAAHLLAPLSLDRFMLDAGLTILARGGNVLWVGSMREIVDDPMSRARFRLALASADRVFALDRVIDATEHGELIWDLEGAAPISAASPVSTLSPRSILSESIVSESALSAA